jgi:hypothetical protein
MEARSPVDRLTDRERALARARLENPTVGLAELAKIAKLKNVRASDVRKALIRPEVRAYLLHPPPAADAAGATQFARLSEVERKNRLLDFYGSVMTDSRVAMSERIRAAKEIAEMTAGAKVPVGMHHTAGWDMQKFVEMAGGRPEGEGPDPAGEEDLKN